MSYISTSRASYNRINPNIRIGSRKSKPQVSKEIETLSFPKAKVYVLGGDKPTQFSVTPFNCARIRNTLEGLSIFSSSEIYNLIMKGRSVPCKVNGRNAFIKLAK